jgi:hypothetical protein
MFVDRPHNWPVHFMLTATAAKFYKICSTSCREGAWESGDTAPILFLTSELDRGPRFTPTKGPPVPTGQEAGWVPESVWTQRLQEKFFAPAGDRTPIAWWSSP